MIVDPRVRRHPHRLRAVGDVPAPQREARRRRCGGRCCSSMAPSSTSAAAVRHHPAIMDRALAASLEVGDLIYAGYNGSHVVWHTLEKGDRSTRCWRSRGGSPGLPADPQRADVPDAAPVRPVRRLPPGADPRAHQLRGRQLRGGGVPGAFPRRGRRRPGSSSTTCSRRSSPSSTGDPGGAGRRDARGRRPGGAPTWARRSRSRTTFFTRSSWPRDLAEAPPEAAEPPPRGPAQKQGKLQLWAENCPENFLNRHLLVSAELARIEGRALEAMRLYEQAIRVGRGARPGALRGDGQRAGGPLLPRAGLRPASPTVYLREARACYSRWGAEGKVKELDRRHPRLRERRRLPRP